MAAAESSVRFTLGAYLRREPSLLSARLELAKRILAAVARRHELGQPAGRLDRETILLQGVRSLRVELADDGPSSGVRRRNARNAREGMEGWAVGDVRALGRVLGLLLADEDLPAAAARVIATMQSDVAPYADARLARDAFIRAV